VIEGTVNERTMVIEQAAYNKIDLLIISYDKIKNSLQALKQLNFFYVVLDEAHKIKNSKALIT